MEGEAGAGAVRVRVNGKFEVVSLQLDRAMLLTLAMPGDPGGGVPTDSDLRMIEDLIAALQEGRPLDEAQRSLLTRLAADPTAGEAAQAEPQGDESDPKRSVDYWRAKFAELPEL